MLQNFHDLSGIPPEIMHYVLEDVSECKLHRETVDSAYTDLPFLLTPFKDNSHLTAVQFTLRRNGDAINVQ